MEIVEGGRVMPRGNKSKRYEGFEQRMSALTVGVIVVCCVLGVRLWQLQVVEGQTYAKAAEKNRLDYEVLKSPRGVIYGRDRNVVLADNRAASDLMLTPALLPNAESFGRELGAVAETLDTTTAKILDRAVIALEQADPVAALADGAELSERERVELETFLASVSRIREVCAQLGELVDINADTLFMRVADAIRRKLPYEQILVKEDISRTERMRVEEYAFALQGVYTVARPQRRYYYGDTAGQILGWFNEISETEYNRLKPRYSLGDVIGRDGIEQAYESQLKGQDGTMIVSRYNGSVPQLRTDARGNPFIEVDSKGRPLVLEERVDAVPGKPVFTTVDIGLQQECERILKDDLFAEDIVDTPAEGAIVVLNADTGEVLALASVPTYDPNVFATKTPDQHRLIDAVLRDPKKPMVNRAFQVHYPPGSTFKVLLAIAALEENAINEHTTYGCGGSYTHGGHTWRCWRRGGHGGVAVVDALAYSCDVFFYNVGLRTGAEKIKKWSSLLGLGEKTGIDLPREVPGNIPSLEWKIAFAKARKSKNPDDYRWYPGDTINMSIGQGMVDATALQNAVLMAAVVNGGKRVRPYVNLELGPRVSPPLISENTLRIVREGMLKCVEKKTPPSGTGREARIEGLEMYGKTGTAQVAHLSQLKGRKEREIPYELRDHALFIAGVSNMQPRIAVSVIVEHGLHGSTTAAPVAKKVFEYFYLKKKEQGEPGEIPTPVTVASRTESVE